MVEIRTRFHRLLTTGLLLWIGRMEDDILALSEKPDSSEALSALRLLTLYHKTHYPEPTSDSLLYVIAYGGPAIVWQDGSPVGATVELRLMKGTQIRASSGPAAIVADAPLLGDIAEALLTELGQLGKGAPGRSVIHKPDDTTEDRDFERACRLERADVTYHPSLEGVDGKVLHAVAYRLMLTFRIGRY